MSCKNLDFVDRSLSGKMMYEPAMNDTEIGNKRLHMAWRTNNIEYAKRRSVSFGKG